ncbi:hypothetical protein ABZ297_16500 [Nonomuraea sp. NPDC005983]|uniref:hypothetical protein n=1 Tax=Nonomuraea sp. NPDC005983 TaxID=3155595 RepID=UPI0033AC56B9
MREVEELSAGEPALDGRPGRYGSPKNSEGPILNNSDLRAVLKKFGLSGDHLDKDVKPLVRLRKGPLVARRLPCGLVSDLRRNSPGDLSLVAWHGEE